MATTQENNEVADAVETVSERKNVESETLEVSVDKPDDSVQAETEPVVSEKADTEATDMDTVSSEQAEIQPASEEALASDQAETQVVSEEVVVSEQAEVQEVSKEATVSVERVETQPANEEALVPEQAETQPASEEALTSEHTETQPASEEALAAEHVETQPESEEALAASEHAEAQPESEEALAAEHVETQPASEEALALEQAETQPESDEALASEQVETQPVSEEALVSEQVETQPESEEALASEQVETQPVSEEVLVSEQVEMQEVCADALASEQDEANQESTDAVGSEQVVLESVDEEPTDMKQDEVEAASTEPQPLNNEDTQADLTDATDVAENQQFVHMEPIDVDDANMQHVSSEHADQQQQTSAEFIHSEAVSSEQVNAEAEPMNVDIPEQHPSDSELVYTHSDIPEMAASQPMSSELVHPQAVGSEFDNSQVHLEYVHSQSFDHETHSEMYTVETVNEKGEFVKMEHVHPEPMHTEAMSADLEQQLQVSTELMHQLQASSELAHQLHVGPELMHMQPIESEITHSQPMNSELVHSEPLVSEYDHSLGQYDNSEMSNMQLVAADMGNSELVDPDTQPPTKRRKKKSIVWEHFTIEAVGAGCRRACCKVCKQSFAYSTGSKVAGTSHLKRHIAKGSCPLALRQQESNQLTPFAPKSAGAETATPGTATTTDPPKRRYRTNSTPYLIFDQDRCRHEIARMIIMHEYPLNMIEHPGFVAFVQNLQPRFDMVNINTVQGDCVATYLREKQNLQRIIDGMPGRICISVDMWSSSQTTGYVFLHGQFVDHEWKLNKRLLNIVMEPFPESDNALSHAVATCLSYWNSDNKLCSITFNRPMTDAGRENMRGLLSVKNPSILNGQLLVGGCLARSLSSMAQDILAAGQDAVRKIRSSVKYVKTSDALEDKFIELKLQLQVPSEKTLILDNVTRWNTTYDMLVAACELKEVFSCLDTSDPEYKDAPTMEDWKQAENICMYLRLLFETANFLLAKTPSSTNLFFHEVWKIQLELTRNAASEDPFVSNVAGILLEKFLKYWRDSFMVLAIAVAMDPRFKMKLVEFSFSKLFGEEAPAYIRMVDEGIHELFHEYVALPPPDANGANSKAEESQPSGFVASNGLTDFDMYIMETNSQQMKSELDQYLDESLLPRVQDLDVLGWWRLNKVKYPTLSKMARDILSVPLSSVGPDYVFDTVSREMDQYRCSLRPETLEALMCAKDWLDYEQHAEASNGHVKIEGKL